MLYAGDSAPEPPSAMCRALPATYVVYAVFGIYGVYAVYAVYAAYVIYAPHGMYAAYAVYADAAYSVNVAYAVYAVWSAFWHVAVAFWLASYVCVLFCVLRLWMRSGCALCFWLRCDMRSACGGCVLACALPPFWARLLGIASQRSELRSRVLECAKSQNTAIWCNLGLARIHNMSSHAVAKKHSFHCGISAFATQRKSISGQ